MIPLRHLAGEAAIELMVQDFVSQFVIHANFMTNMYVLFSVLAMQTPYVLIDMYFYVCV